MQIQKDAEIVAGPGCTSVCVYVCVDVCVRAWRACVRAYVHTSRQKVGTVFSTTETNSVFDIFTDSTRDFYSLIIQHYYYT